MDCMKLNNSKFIKKGRSFSTIFADLKTKIMNIMSRHTLSEKMVLSRTKKGSSANALLEPLKNL